MEGAYRARRGRGEEREARKDDLAVSLSLSLQ